MRYPLPPPDILQALQWAARYRRIPLTFLTAIAYAESGYNPKAVGKPRKNGEQAQGLMQLMPSTIKALQIGGGDWDPFDPVMNADVAALYIGRLGKALGWKWGEIAAAYNWGPGAYAKSIVSTQPMPASVVEFRAKVLAARGFFQTLYDKPKRQSSMKMLGAAIEALSVANPDWPVATVLRDKWMALAYGDPVNPAIEWGDLRAYGNSDVRKMWEYYVALYDRAPITDRTTPMPFEVEPVITRPLENLADDAKDKAKDLANDAADLASDAKESAEKALEFLGEKAKTGVEFAGDYFSTAGKIVESLPTILFGVAAIWVLMNVFPSKR